jgi:hypothetical protein
MIIPCWTSVKVYLWSLQTELFYFLSLLEVHVFKNEKKIVCVLLKFYLHQMSHSASIETKLAQTKYVDDVSKFTNTNINWNCHDKSKLCKFISKRRIISLRHSSILKQIWINFKALCLVFIRQLFQFSHPPRISNFFDLSITEETWVVEMRIWCIKIVNVLVLHRNNTGQSLFINCNLVINKHFEPLCKKSLPPVWSECKRTYSILFYQDTRGMRTTTQCFGLFWHQNDWIPCQSILIM